MNLRVKERARRRRRSRLPRQSLPRLGILKILSKRNNKDHKDFVFERIRRWFLYWNIYRLWNNHFTRLSLLRSKCPNPSFLTILPVLVINVNHVKDVKRSPQKSDGGYEWCRTCLPCACVGNFPISLVSLAMLSEIYHGLGKVSVNNRLNFAILFIITISLRPAQNAVTQPCWKRVSPARGWRRVYTGLLAFGPPWKIEIVFSQVFGLLLMVTMISHHHHQLWFRSEILKYGVSNLPMAVKRAFERNDGPISWFVIFFIKIWIGDIYDICLLIFVFLILEDLWTKGNM